MNGSPDTAVAIQRRSCHLRGQVQGVGLRPFLYRLAQRFELTGSVRNDGNGVLLEIQGYPDHLDAFARTLPTEAPALARLDRLCWESVPLVEQESSFQIITSVAASSPQAQVTVDTAVCPNCLSEMLDKTDRRHGYGLINCTNCGPRYSIVRGIPYDRPNTTMAGFAMCSACRTEYENPADRRFHAQPISCPQCGPQVSFADATGKPLDGDPIVHSRQWLLDGRTVAIKGIGGFHLAVRADHEQALAPFRPPKQRDSKPFALMCANLQQAEQIVSLSAEGRELLNSPQLPIVLAPRLPSDHIAPSVAPGQFCLGVMLPYTPLQHLLLASGDLPCLVMTSANISDEPLVIDNGAAIERIGLTGICDAFLWHDRPIQRCADDSVLIDLPAGPALPLRRARGYVPGRIRLPFTCDTSGLCLGGDLKNTVAVVHEDQVTLSQHLGDLKHPLSYESFQQAVTDLVDLCAIQPQWIAHDLHPLYQSTVFAQQLAAEHGLPLVPLQHHHAHAASLMAEQGLSGPVLAIVCDGTGYGTDGTIWGGELLLADFAGFRRLAHLRAIGLPGGDAAAKDTRRCGLSLLAQLDPEGFERTSAAVNLYADPADLGLLAQMLRSAVNCPISSGAGRYFDGIAALLGLCTDNSHEARAAQRLEAAARCYKGDLQGGPLYSLNEHSDGIVIDFSPFVAYAIKYTDSEVQKLAAWWHEQFAQAWMQTVMRMSRQYPACDVVLSGGVFCNVLLTQRLTGLLEAQGMQVHRHQVVPPTDGGLALGQAAIAAYQNRRTGDHKKGGMN